jgi:hypothetical protein
MKAIQGTLYPATVPVITLKTFLPGTGKQTSEWCGQIRAYAVCSSGEDHIRIPVRGNNCGDPGCPICWPRWATRGADRIGDSATGFREAAKEAGKSLPWPNHVIWSPPPGKIKQKEENEWKNAEGAKRLRNLLMKGFYQVAGPAGSYAGVAIPHLVRIKEEYKLTVHQKAQELKTKHWEAVKSFSDWDDMVYFSPHVHSVSYGHLQKSNDFHTETGWIYHNKGPLRSREDIECVAFYALSHSLIIPGTQAPIRYGLMQSKTLRLIEHGTIRISCTCPVCGSPLVKEYLNMEGLTMATTDEVTRTRIMNRYALLLGAGPPAIAKCKRC